MYRIILISLLLVSASVHARMYQWTDPESGTTQLSGKPPSWYRSSEQGPRVIVFEKGRIVDDTQIQISDNERETLRQQAFIKVEEDLARAQQQALEAEQLKAALQKEQDHAETQTVEIDAGDVIDTRRTAVPEEPVVPEVDDVTAEEMRALIDMWEQQKTQQAKQKIEESDMSATEFTSGESAQ